MPTIKIEELNLTLDQMNIVKCILKKDGSIRLSKPKIKNTDHKTGKAAYIWRMLAFQVSKNPVHHCMPVCATFDLPAYDDCGRWRSNLANEMARDLKVIEDEIMKQISCLQWYGIKKWSRALGY